MIRHLFFSLLIGMGATCCIGAPREFSTIPSQTPIASLVQVVVPGACCAAVSETQSLLAIGHKVTNGKHLVIYTLDPATGNPSVTPATEIALPSPASLQKYENYPVSIAFHPTLPLLYVWQDINAPELPASTDARNPVYQEFDHLLIYSVQAGGALQLVQSLARGPIFAYRQIWGRIEIDGVQQRVFMPNLRNLRAALASNAAVGYYQLDVQGLPARTVSQPVPTPKVLAPEETYPMGLGFAGASKDAVVVGALSGPIVWEFENRRVNAARVYLYNAGMIMVSGHPKLPFIYMSALNNPFVYCMEHVDGFLTLLPQKVGIDGASYKSAPVVMTKQNMIAIGGVNCVYAIKLDANGRLTSEMQISPLNQAQVLAIAYSEKLDHLYVGVDALK